jgi:hypothetical protein
MLCFLLSIVLASQDYEVLDQTDDTWTAPGYFFTIECQIDPLDFSGEDLLSNPGHFNLGSRAFFVDTTSGETWRIVLLFKDKLVVLEEGQEPNEYLFSSPEACHFYMSGNGQWALVEYWSPDQANACDISGEFPGLELIDITSRTRIDVDNSELLPSGWIVADNGSLLACNSQGIAFLNPITSYLHRVDFHDVDPTEFRFAQSADGNLAVIREDSSGEPRFTGYNGLGTEIWSIQDPNDSWISDLKVTPDGSHACVCRNDGLLILNGETGEIEERAFRGERVKEIQLALDGSKLAFCIWEPNWSGSVRDGIVVSSVTNIETFSLLEYNARIGNWYTPCPKQVSSNGVVLFYAFAFTPLWRWGLANLDDELIWLSPSYVPGISGIHLVQGNRDLYNECEGDTGSPHALSTNGERIVYSDDKFIYVARIAMEI